MEYIELLLLLMVNISLRSCTILEDFQNACPYSNFCTTPSLKKFNASDDVIPCCHDCFCGEDCWAHGDCCPDLDSNEIRSNGLSILLECKPAYVENSFMSSVLEQLPWYVADFPHYRIIDFCPDSFPVDHVVHKNCLGHFDSLLDFDDVVLVSDESFRIFKNKHCALCHGQKQLTRWKPVTSDCRDQLAKVRLTLSELEFYFLKYCAITFERPDKVPLNGRTMDCRTASCASQNSDQKVWEQCTQGPHMPYLHVHKPGLSKLYKNVMCAKCNREILEVETCPADDRFLTKSTLSSYRVFLSPVTKSVSESPVKKSKCSESGIYDPYKKACRPMLCPPFEVASFGKCVKMSEKISDLYLDISIVFPVDVNMTFDLLNGNVYNESVSKYQLKQIVDTFGFSGCTFYDYTSYVITDKISHRIVAILTTLLITIDKQCSLIRLAKIIKFLEQYERSIDWLIDGKNIQLKGQISFINSIETWRQYGHRIIMYQDMVRKNVRRVQEFFLCRYIVLNYKEYQNHIKDVANITTLDTVSTLSLSTNLLPSFYALTEKEIAVCVENYLPPRSGSSVITQSIFFIKVIYILKKIP